MSKEVLDKVVRGKLWSIGLVALLLFVSLSSFVLAAPVEEGTDWGAPVTWIKICGWFILGLSLIITLIPKGKELAHTHKTFFFMLYLVPIVAVSLFLAINTIHHNIISETKGPVHWHADYEVWLCDEKVDLVDPRGLRNKIGTPLFHEHNDDRIHVEGTVMKLEDVNLGNYFRVIGGELTSSKISFDIEDIGVVTYETGDACADGSIGELGVYVNGQRQVDPASYVLSPEIFVPNGDCIIFEFGPNLGETTNRICPSWEANEMTYEKFMEMKEANS